MFSLFSFVLQNKDTSEPRSRGGSSSSRGGRGGADRYVGRGSSGFWLMLNILSLSNGLTVKLK